MFLYNADNCASNVDFFHQQILKKMFLYRSRDFHFICNALLHHCDKQYAHRNRINEYKHISVSKFKMLYNFGSIHHRLICCRIPVLLTFHYTFVSKNTCFISIAAPKKTPEFVESMHLWLNRRITFSLNCSLHKRHSVSSSCSDRT